MSIGFQGCADLFLSDGSGFLYLYACCNLNLPEAHDSARDAVDGEIWISRDSLPEPEIHVRETPYVAPQNDSEAELARGFAIALGMEKVSAAEDFFAAGGDSLSIVRLLSECRGLELNFNLIYEGKTPQGIAKLLERRQSRSQSEKRDTHFLQTG